MLKKTNSTPRVSVIMSVYNGAEFLGQAIESILKQSLSDFEFVIVDDASTDASPDILRKYSLFDSRIRILNNVNNIGLTKSLNRATKEAGGEYLARIDADDFSYPERLKLQVDFLDQHPDVGLVGSWANIIDADSKVLRTVKYLTEPEKLKDILIKYNPFFHSSIMIRKDIMDKVGLYDESFTFSQDYDLYFRVSRECRIANLPDILIGYRELHNSITGSQNRKQISFVIKAKLKAIKNRQYSKINYYHLIRPCLSWLLPRSIKKMIKKFFLL